MAIPENNGIPNPGSPQNGWNEVPNGTPGTGQGSYKVDVTPQSPFGQQKPIQAPKIATNKGQAKLPIKYLLIAILVVFIAVVALVSLHKPAQTTTIVTTSIKPNVYTFSACGAINSPGSYYVNSNIRTNVTSGPCISIDSNDVSLVCNGKSVTGSGPYSDAVPYSYAIYLDGKSNVSISGCELSDFSYGVMAINSTSLNIENNNIYNNTMSGIYFSGTTDSYVSSNKVMGSSSGQGAIHIGSGSTADRLSNNTVLSNGEVGITLNASAETVDNNYVNSTPTSFLCKGSTGLINSSSALSNKCTVNNGCNFLSCSVTNYPVNISQISLGHVFDSCGVISVPGNYHVSQSINANIYYKAVGAVNETSTPCISIDASDVHLDCDGVNITNVSDSYAIYANSESGLVIDNCNVYSSRYGIMLYNVSGANVSNVNIYSTNAGVTLLDSKGNILSKIKERNGKVGMFINSSTLNTLTQFSISNNSYGLYIDNSVGNVYSNGTVIGNSRMDIYASNNSAESGYSLMANTNCGLTNADWTTCSNVEKPQLKYYPINSCMTIGYSGNYSLSSNLLMTSSPCLRITANNVSLSCNGHRISAATNGKGTGIYANNVDNVSISGCSINNAEYGYYISNSSDSSILGGNSTGNSFGIYIYESNSIRINGTSQASVGNVGLYLNNSYRNIVTYSNFNSGEYGIYSKNSKDNVLQNNNGTSNGIGMYFDTSSTNNTVSKNDFSGSSKYDYSCSGSSSGIDSEIGGLNYGQKVSNCEWASGVSVNSGPIACDAFFSPSTYYVGADSYYGLGATCEGVYSNSTTINCGYNVITATNGGTFAIFKNVKNGVIKDCILRGFSTPIVIDNSSVKAYNNIIYVNASNPATEVSDYGIGVFSSQGFSLSNDTIINTNSSGAVIENSVGGSVSTMNVSAPLGYYIKNTSSTYFNSNYANTIGVGIAVVNSTQNSFVKNSFSGAIAGALCSGSSKDNSSNTNLGSNYCSINSGCAWFGSDSC